MLNADLHLAEEQFQTPSTPLNSLVYDIQMIVYAVINYWPYMVGLTVAICAARILTKFKRGQKNKTTTQSTTTSTASEKNLEKLLDLVGFFLDEMDDAGQPGKAPLVLKSIENDKNRSNYWGYGPISFTVPPGTEGWEVKVSPTQEPGGWMSASWNEAIITATGDRWAVIGFHTKTMYAHGEDRDVNQAVIKSGDLAASGQISDEVLSTMAAAIQTILEKHLPTALPEFLMLRNKK